MPTPAWRAVRPEDARTLRDARQQTHYAAQLATALGISYLPRRADDSHTNLEWLPELSALASNPVTRGASSVRIAVVVPTLSLAVLENGTERSRQALHGKTIEDAASWVRSALEQCGLDPATYTLKRHYEIPPHAVASGSAFNSSASAAFDQLANWFHDGALALETIRRGHKGASDVRCWPHHFDVGLVIAVGGRGGAEKSVGAGMEPGDVYYDEPYFYVNMNPAPPAPPAPRAKAEALRTTLRGDGSWHTREWIGAVLPGSRVTRDVAGQENQATQFLESAVAAALALV